MCDLDQHKDSLRNVALAADGTWANELCTFQKANMNLYLQTRKSNYSWARLSPRTVRDSIPNSKLAQYSDYEYDESRELSYSPMIITFERLYPTFVKEEIREPWMLEEIDDLYIGFLTYKDSDELCMESHEALPCHKKFCELAYESPFTLARNFDEMALKLKIVSRNIKKIWDTKYFPYDGWHPIGKIKNLVLFKSPTCQMFSTINEEKVSNEWSKEKTESEENASQIKVLAQSFKEQNTWIFKKQSSRSWLEPDSVDLSSHKRLYSAVLQGSSPNHNPMTSFHFPSIKKKRESTSTETDCYHRSVNTVGTQQASGYQPYYYPPRSNVPSISSTSPSSVYVTPTSYHNIPQASTFLQPRLYATSNYIPNSTVLNFRQTNYFPLVLQNATTPYVQTSFFNYQRGTAFPNYRTMIVPQRPQIVVPPSGWYYQQPIKLTQPTLNFIRPTTQTSTYPYYQRSNNTNKSRVVKPTPTTQDIDDIVAKTINNVLDDADSFVPITETPSDELELEALEQYSPSCTNVFQELERQAAEQYETSENWKSPPRCRDSTAIVGGWCGLDVRLVRLRYAQVRRVSLGLGFSTVRVEVPVLFGCDSRN